MLSVGEILKKEREKQGITLADVEIKTKIQQKFLAAIEKNDWSFFSSKVYIAGIIHTYSLYLGLDPSKTQAFFRRDYERVEDIQFKEKISKNATASQSRRLIIFGLTFLACLFIVYFLYQLKLYLSPPTLSIISPQTATFANTDRVKIIGKTDKEAEITIFGQRVFLNKDGMFEYTFPLKVGRNELVIEVVGANGKKTVSKRIFFRAS